MGMKNTSLENHIAQMKSEIHVTEQSKELGDEKLQSLETELSELKILLRDKSDEIAKLQRDL